MKVSIVTISYNQGEFLERAIRSVIEQDYDDIEYIIVDPGSTDGSRDIIERYQSKIDKVIFEPDKGPADGLNKGFSYATGDILGFLNSDDILLSGALSHIVNFFKTHPTVDVVSGHAIIIDEQDRELRKSYSDHFSLQRYAYSAVVLMQPSTFFRSNIFKKTQRFNVSNRTNWDGELFVDLCLQGARYALTDCFLSGYRLQRESITASRKLYDEIKAYHRAIFRKIMGRDMKPRDYPLSIMLRFIKHVRSPRVLYERLSKGPIYGRSASYIAPGCKVEYALRKVGLIVSIFFPWPIRRWLLEKFFGYNIHPTSRIGIAWVLPQSLIMEAYSRIDHLTVCKGLEVLWLKKHATIGKGNWITGFPLGNLSHFSHQKDRKPQLILNDHSAITSRHLIDCTNSVTIGKFSTVAGYRSQIMTHSIDLEHCKQSSTSIVIGDYCFVGTNCVLLGGSSLPSYSVLGAKSLLNKCHRESNWLYAGVPARPIKQLSKELKYFTRSTGFVE